MHGRLQREGRNCSGLRRSTRQHMRSVLPLASNENTVDHDSCLASVTTTTTTTTTSDSFFKDGRKISVGDCALFKPPRDAPPFIGLIRWVALGKDNILQLGVNWLYRPAEIKLGKGTLVDSAPNEVFYSFHKDETPAASLLHPCKVAFLPRGAELPTGTSSFVCRRVYDIANKCLWWLTDQDFINERQVEVDQLLYKTKLEMHAALQPGGRSPKQANPSSTSQLKPASDSGQNSGTFSSQVKGKKRERGDHSTDPVKRERSLRTDDGDSIQCKIENNLKSEIARITENGGLVDLEGVDKLVLLMRPDRIERKLDLVCRSMLANVVAGTDKVDCLNHFMQVRGLPVLDEWLQDVHKGKIGDANSLKDTDKSVEEFLLVLLRALDKLPVNLQALQMCNIGRSVNHLRTHKNVDIQRKARTLVDTWKKGVEAEMISIDAKSGSAQGVSAWPSKSRLPDSNHGSRTLSGSDVAIKSSTTQTSGLKTTSARSSHGNISNVKSLTSSPGAAKPSSSPASGKESHPRLSAPGTPDGPPVREDRSSSSNQSHNYSQSFSGKDDVKSSVPGSVAVGKISVSTRNRKTSGYPGLSGAGNQKEVNSGRSTSAHRSNAMEKVTQSGLGSERVLEGAVTEGSNHKLIVKIPNLVRSPAQGAAGGSAEDPTYRISQSSPLPINKHEQLDPIAKDRIDGYRCNVTSDIYSETWHNNDSKDAVVGSAGGAESPVVPPDEEHSMTTGDSRRSIEGSTTNHLKPEKLHASSFSPMTALVESCAKYSEANSSLSLEDDVGMNLLASVAAGEMSRSELVSPSNSTSTPAAEEVFVVDEARSKSSEDYMEGVRSLLYNDAESNGKKQAVLDGCSGSVDALHMSKHAAPECSVERKSTDPHNRGDIPAGESNKHLESCSGDLTRNAEPKCETNEKLDPKNIRPPLAIPTSMEKVRDGKSDEEMQEKRRGPTDVSSDGIIISQNNATNVVTEDKACIDLITVEKDLKNVEVAISKQLGEGDCQKDMNKGLNMETDTMQKLVTSETIKTSNNEKLQQTGFEQKPVVESIHDLQVGEPNEKSIKHSFERSERLNSDKGRDAGVENSGVASVRPSLNDLEGHHKESNDRNKEILGHVSVKHETEQKTELRESNTSSNKLSEAEGSASTAAEDSPSSAGASDLGAKIKFDLNEGFSVDDVKYGEPVNVPSGMPNFPVVTSLPFSINSIPSGNPSSITVAAAAKGPFVPPEVLSSKKELGWKGSAATSAFRPAEPRKALDSLLGPTNVSSPDTSTSNQSRVLFDFDLNVPDERVLEELAARDSTSAVNLTNNRSFLNEAKEAPRSIPVRGFGGLDLDLNRVDEVHDNSQCSTSSARKGEGPIMHLKQLGGLHTGDIRRDFDLNNGPGVDDSSTEQFAVNQPVKGVILSQFPTAGLRMNSPGLGSFSSWFPPGNTFSTVAIPSMIPGRGEQPFPVFPPNASQRTFGPSGVAPLTPDIYRGSVLSSSPAVPFQPSPFQFPVLPFGSTFPLPSATFPVGPTSYAESSSGPRLFAPSVNSQLLGPVATVTSQFQRPYMVSIPDNSSNGGLDNNRNWGRHGLDLNAGPASLETEVREDMLPLSSGQHTVAGSQSLLDEHARFFSVSGGVFKRKEPEGGWDTENFRYKQSSKQ